MLLSGWAATRRRYSTFNYRLLSLNFIALKTKGVAGDCHKTVHFLKTTQFDNVYWPSPPLVSLSWCRVLYSSGGWLHLDGIRTAVITFFIALYFLRVHSRRIEGQSSGIFSETIVRRSPFVVRVLFRWSTLRDFKIVIKQLQFAVENII